MVAIMTIVIATIVATRVNFVHRSTKALLSWHELVDTSQLRNEWVAMLDRVVL